MTDEVIRDHLSGKTIIGIYPMLLDETCHFLAVDFDGESWADDAMAFFETCQHQDIPVALERSRSGKGGHVWLFFAEAVSATLARKLGSHILTETTERRPQTTFASYDRFFPNQNTLPRGGFVQTNIRARRNLLGKTEATPVADLSEEDQERLAILREDLARKLKAVKLLLPAGLHEEATPALKSALLIKAQIKALETQAPGPSNESELSNPEFSYLHGKPKVVNRFMVEPSAELAEELFKNF